MKKVIVSVINDLSTDQRVHKVCSTLHRNGYNVTLVGRKQRTSLALTKREYSTIRMSLLFEKGPLFYLEFQIRLFILLVFKKAEILYSNDLDTLLPNFLISKIKKTVLVYDSHELFCEVPELKKHPIKKRIWKTLEQFIFPKLKYVFTVNKSIAGIYRDEYKVTVHVLRNFPLLSPNLQNDFKLTRADLGIGNDKKIIIIQSAGINIDRGDEEAVQAMQYVKNSILLIVGSGDVIGKLKKMTTDLGLSDKVLFTGKVPFEKLAQYTRLANIGLCLIKDTNLNYRYSLPNKISDYIHAGVPILATELEEIKNIITQYNVGTFIQNHSPEHIAEMLNYLLNAPEILQRWKLNTAKAVEELNWDAEEKTVLSVFEQF